MEEPSVLDLLKSKLRFRKTGQAVPVPPGAEEYPEPSPRRGVGIGRLPWRSLGALALALIAQVSWEPPTRSVWTGVAFYIAAFGLLIGAFIHREWTLAEPESGQTVSQDTLHIRLAPLLAGTLFAIAAFVLFGGNKFTPANLTLWLAALSCFAWAFWKHEPAGKPSWMRLRAFLGREQWSLNISRWTLIVLVAIGIVLFFRLSDLAGTPLEAFSDHAEKILDIYDIMQGQTHIFFPRNTGREALQMYWTLLVAKVFATGLSFFSLKLGAALLGLLTLPYMYLLGKEIGGRRVALLALLITGIAYWPNVISRVGLRFPLYPLFVAPTLYYLIRGLRNRNRNDFILAGIFLGIGLHGYSPIRILPFVVVIAVGIYLLHRQSKGIRQQAVAWLAVLASMSLAFFLPLLRYWIEAPGEFTYRTLTRISTTETALPGPWWQVFFSNLWNGLRMFNWDNGEIWVHSVTHRPALDVVSAAFFLLGVVLLLARYIQKRNWLDLFLLLSIPLLQLPSTLSLAFPQENPALNRAAGAFVPAFLVVALAFDGLWTGLRSALDRRAGRAFITGLFVFLFGWSGMQNYGLVFHQYRTQIEASVLNTSEMGQVVEQFQQTYGTSETVWIVPYPYWVDTRLPAIWAGIPNRDMALWPDRLADSLSWSGPKLFIVKLDDQSTLDALQGLYPHGSTSRYEGGTDNFDFMLFFVPADD